MHICMLPSRSNVIVWLKYFMCIGFALPVQTTHLHFGYKNKPNPMNG